MRWKFAVTTPATTSQTRARDTTAATAARGSAKGATLLTTAEVILTTAGGAKWQRIVPRGTLPWNTTTYTVAKITK